jgi:hypothetical protein
LILKNKVFIENGSKNNENVDIRISGITFTKYAQSGRKIEMPNNLRVYEIMSRCKNLIYK